MGNLIRSITVDLDKMARDLLVRPDPFFDSETILEVYRHVVVTGEERGRRWRHHDSWSHSRYPDFHTLVGATYRDHLPDTRFALTGHHVFRDHIARVITRTVLGNDPVLARWRRDQGNIRRLTLDLRLRRAAKERFVSLDRMLTDHLGRRMSVQFNSCHDSARVIFRVLLIPAAEGWALGIEYGCPDDALDLRNGRAYSSWIASKLGSLGPDDPEDKVPMQANNEPASLFVQRCVTYLHSITETTR